MTAEPLKNSTLVRALRAKLRANDDDLDLMMRTVERLAMRAEEPIEAALLDLIFALVRNDPDRPRKTLTDIERAQLERLRRSNQIGRVKNMQQGRLTVRQVGRIKREMLDHDGPTLKAAENCLAAEYNVHPSTIRAIFYGRSWSCVPAEPPEVRPREAT